MHLNIDSFLSIQTPYTPLPIPYVPKCASKRPIIHRHTYLSAGTFPVSVYGSFLPRHLFYRFHAVCAYVRCLYVALCIFLFHPAFDVVIADQVSAVVPILHLTGTKVSESTSSTRIGEGGRGK